MLKKNPKQLLLLNVALIVAVAMSAPKAHAQVMGSLHVTVPFEFQVGTITLQPGKYIVQPVDESDLTVMEIRNADGSSSAFFEVQSVEARSVPAKDELIFKKYGNHYFLADVFEEGNRSGDKLIQSRNEPNTGQALDGPEDVSAHHGR
jgi:hypothetical protein